MRGIHFVIGAFAVLAAAACAKQGSAPTRTITVATFGSGEYLGSHRRAFCEPYSIYNDVSVRSVPWSGDYGELKEMVESGDVAWDVVEVPEAHVLRARAEGLLEPIAVKPGDGDFPDEFTISKNAIGIIYWTTMIAYRTEMPRHPKTWRDFFDVANYPGDRALFDGPRGNLEFALLAAAETEGKKVEPGDLYPLDVEQAFRKLDQLAPRVTRWWKKSVEPVQLLAAGVVQLSSIHNGRIYTMQTERTRIGYSWEGAALELDYWVIPKGASNPDLASRFVAFASSTHAMTRMARDVGYGPVNRAALTRLKKQDQEQKLNLPRPGLEGVFRLDAGWWSANEARLERRWKVWRKKWAGGGE